MKKSVYEFLEGVIGLEYRGNFPIRNKQDKLKTLPYVSGFMAKGFLLGGALILDGDGSISQQLLGLGLAADATLTAYRPVRNKLKKPPAGLVGIILDHVYSKKQQ